MRSGLGCWRISCIDPRGFHRERSGGVPAFGPRIEAASDLRSTAQG
jgi:hypothetical protein